MQERDGLAERGEERPLRVRWQGVVGTACARGDKVPVGDNVADQHVPGAAPAHALDLDVAGVGQNGDDQPGQAPVRVVDVLHRDVEQVEQQEGPRAPVLYSAQHLQGRSYALSPPDAIRRTGGVVLKHLDTKRPIVVLQVQEVGLTTLPPVRHVHPGYDLAALDRVGGDKGRAIIVQPDRPRHLVNAVIVTEIVVHHVARTSRASKYCARARGRVPIEVSGPLCHLWLPQWAAPARW